MDTATRVERIRHHRWGASVFWFAAVVVFFIWVGMVGLAFFLLAPHKTFFDYAALKPRVTKVGEPLLFVATRNIKTTVEIRTDVKLYCKNAEGMWSFVAGEVTFDPDTEVAVIMRPTDGYKDSKPWIMWRQGLGYVPTQPGTCYIDMRIWGISYIYGIPIAKTQSVATGEFEITP